MKLLLVFAAASLVLTLILTSSESHSADDPSKTPIVLVQPAKLSELFDVLSYPARVVPRINANVLTETDGVVVKIFAPLGSKVSRHERLMLIRHTDPVYQYAPAVVTSPVAGVVSSVDVSEGSLVTKGSRVAGVTDPSQVRIEVEIAAADLNLIKPGLKGELRVDGGSQPVAVQVRGLSPFVDPATGTATCELEIAAPVTKPRDGLPDTRSPVAPGMVGQVRFKVNAHEGFSLPEDAVVYRGNDTFVRVVVGGKAHFLPVSIGRKSRGNVEIAKGLSENAKVIERASQFIGEGETVNVQETRL